MLKLTVTVLLLVSLTFTFSDAQRSGCKNGAVFTMCGTCERTCDTLDTVCTMECRIGCYCPQNYVRNNEGECIPITEC
ncbi:chymotrypsin inhibitor [Neodiprion virginianus]|uniref:chymotrypsin inhibitor n=1 Tax=Neodiprion virginianus TaxID=2961670 RepID=UPI001EE6C78A|nr:chymotrypsin inhibitor [Neodiprion virginianus]